MKIHRFLIQEKIEKQSEINITDLNLIKQMLNVLRFKINDQVILIDGCGGEFLGKIKTLEKKLIVVKKEKIILQKENTSKKLTLAISILKKDKFEWVLQKGTELGVNEFIPTLSDRTEKIKINFERAKKIINEAAEQSEKKFLPVLHEVVKLKNYIKQNIEKIDNMIVLDLDAPKINPEFLKNKKENLIIFVGPEGGWSNEERNFFKENNLKIFSLGDFVLRAETAGISVVASLTIGQ